MRFAKPLIITLLVLFGLWGLNEWSENYITNQAAAESAEDLARGKSMGYDAAVAAQDAVRPGQWHQVAEQWESAIDALENVPRESPSYLEAQAKADEYRENKIAALTQKSKAEQSQGTDIDRFLRLVADNDPNGVAVSGASVDPQHPEFVDVTVTTAFLAQPIAVQKEVAAGLQRAWAATYSPLEPDKAYLRLLTPSGNKFGGSRLLVGGTAIYIDE